MKKRQDEATSKETLEDLEESSEVEEEADDSAPLSPDGGFNEESERDDAGPM